MLRIAVVGAGFAGSSLVTRLIQHLSDLNLRHSEVQIIHIEQDSSLYGKGIAYGASSSFHKTNVPLGRMSATEDPNDLRNWLDMNGHADLHSDAAIPRSLYGEYIKQKLDDAVANLPVNVTYLPLNAVVTSVHVQRDKYLLYLGGGFTIPVEILVMATGNAKISQPYLFDGLASDRYIQDVWMPEGKAKLLAIPTDATIGIIGTGLTSYDICLSLEAQGHEGKVTLISRNGNRHFSYPPVGEFYHPAIAVERPDFLDVTSKQELEEEFLATWIWLRDGFGLPSERILEAWQPYMDEFISRWGMDYALELLNRYKSLITTSRVGVTHQVHQAVEDFLSSNGGEVIAAEIQAVLPLSDRLTLCWKSEANGFNCDNFGFIINATGRSVYSPLIDQLVSQKMMMLHPFGGVQMDEYCRAIDVNGQACPTLYAVGALQTGHNMQAKGILIPSAGAAPNLKAGIFSAAEAIAKTCADYEDFHSRQHWFAIAVSMGMWV